MQQGCLCLNKKYNHLLIFYFPMLNSIEINTLNQRKYSHHYKEQYTFKHCDYNPKTTTHKMTPPLVNNQNLHNVRTIVPVKEYSNKFLRESSSNTLAHVREKYVENKKFDHLVKKHKRMQKRYVCTKNDNICKTEPNQIQYKCFATFYSFHHDKSNQKIKTDDFIGKTAQSYQEFAAQIDKNIEIIPPNPQTRKKSSNLDNRFKPKPQPPFLSNIINEQRISASRALQLYSKILSKDKSDIVEKIRMNNQKALIKDRIFEKTKNLQTRQVMLFEKQKKMVNQNVFEKRLQSKSNMRFRTKIKSEMKKILIENDNYQLKGWDIIY